MQTANAVARVDTGERSNIIFSSQLARYKSLITGIWKTARGALDPLDVTLLSGIRPIHILFSSTSGLFVLFAAGLKRGTNRFSQWSVQNGTILNHLMEYGTEWNSAKAQGFLFCEF